MGVIRGVICLGEQKVKTPGYSSDSVKTMFAEFPECSEKTAELAESERENS
jgi:hypothetical protein